MNYLQLCQRLRQESGIAESGPSAVTGQVGDLKRIVDWINEAWLRLQSTHTDWKFLWTTDTLTVNAGTALYTLPSTLESIISGTAWLSGSRQSEIAYPAYREMYPALTVTKPGGYSIRPDGQLIFNAIPDQNYVLSYEGYKAPAYFVDGTEAPTMPERFHMLLVWDGLMQYGLYDEAAELIQKGKSEYDKIYAELCLDQLPPFQVAGALA